MRIETGTWILEVQEGVAAIISRTTVVGVEILISADVAITTTAGRTRAVFLVVIEVVDGFEVVAKVVIPIKLEGIISLMILEIVVSTKMCCFGLLTNSSNSILFITFWVEVQLNISLR